MPTINCAIMTDSPTPTIGSKNKSKYILGAILFVMLMIGLAATYWLTQQNQDIRQQASETNYIECGGGYTHGETACASATQCVQCNGVTGRLENIDNSNCDGPCRGAGGYDGDDLCVDSGGNWVGNICYMGGSATCAGPGEGGGDPCAANGGYCSGTDIIRCDCGNGNWVGGKKEVGCATLCKEAGIDCGTTCESPSPRPSTPPPTDRPSPSPSVRPTPSPSPGPQCLSIRMNEPDVESDSYPQIGDSVSFTCGRVVGTTAYKFRIMGPDGIISNINGTGRISASYPIEEAGPYFAQCRICTGANGTACQRWEPLPDPAQ